MGSVQNPLSQTETSVYQRNSEDELSTLLSATVVSPSAVASPKQLWSELERWHLAGHEDDKLGLLCKVLLWSAIVYNQERLRQSGKKKTLH